MQLHTEVKKQPSKRKFKMPDAYVLLFFIALLCAIATYFVPAGEFKELQMVLLQRQYQEVIILFHNRQ